MSNWQKKQHCKKSKFIVMLFCIKKLTFFFFFFFFSNSPLDIILRYCEDLSGFHFNFEVLCSSDVLIVSRFTKIYCTKYIEVKSCNKQACCSANLITVSYKTCTSPITILLLQMCGCRISLPSTSHGVCKLALTSKLLLQHSMRY